MKLTLSEPIIKALPIIRRLREHHFEAFFVGGAVRDLVLHLPIKDVDMATSARPEQVLDLFQHCIPTGLQHGTITVIQDRIAYEVTTFREESVYENHRKPDSVLYITELEGDLLRRDFTMNAMALAEDGELLDPFGGLLDLEKCILRCVGDADSRFQEDALRMLRAVRFIAVYKLRPALATWKALIRHRELFKFIAMERVQNELDKMLAGDSPQRALHFIGASGLLFYLKEPFPKEIEPYLKGFQQTADMLRRFSNLDELHRVDLRWAAIGIGLNLSNDAVKQSLAALRFSKSRMKTITQITAIHNEIKPLLEQAERQDNQSIHRNWISIIIKHGEESAKEWLMVMHAIGNHPQNALSESLTQLEEWLSNVEVSTLKRLKISGSDLTIHLGRQGGSWVSQCLDHLLHLVACGELNNDLTALLEQASIWDSEVQTNGK